MIARKRVKDFFSYSVQQHGKATHLFVEIGQDDTDFILRMWDEATDWP